MIGAMAKRRRNATKAPMANTEKKSPPQGNFPWEIPNTPWEIPNTPWEIPNTPWEIPNFVRGLRAVEDAGDALASAYRARETGFGTLERVTSDVEDFIRSRGLVLYGGQAIQFAVLEAGAEGIYADDVLPDYDFFSATHAADAYELAGLLSVKYHPYRFRVRRAKHVQTMRVRCDELSSEAVADISFLPAAILEKIPTLARNGVKFVHPWWQFVDQHLSLSRPFGRFPGENVFFRWKKEVPRHCLLYSLYPPPAKGGGELAPVKLIRAALGPAVFALSGMTALAALASAFPALAATPSLRAMGESFAVNAAGDVSHLAPAWHCEPACEWDGPHADVVSPGFTAASAREASAGAETRRFRAVMDVAWPAVVVLDRGELCRVENSQHSLVPVAALGAARGGLSVVGCETLLKQLSFWANFRSDRYWEFYTAVHGLVRTFDTGNSSPGPEKSETGSEISRRYWTLLMGVDGANLMGEGEHEAADEFRARKLLEARTGKPDAALTTIPPNFSPTVQALGGPPRVVNTPPSFVPTGPWFTLDGSPIEPRVQFNPAVQTREFVPAEV
jgi:hypothetical protein